MKTCWLSRAISQRGTHPENSTYESTAAPELATLQARRWLLEFVLPGQYRKAPREPSLLLYRAAGRGFPREAEIIMAKAILICCGSFSAAEVAPPIESQMVTENPTSRRYVVAFSGSLGSQVRQRRLDHEGSRFDPDVAATYGTFPVSGYNDHRLGDFSRPS